MAAVDGGTQSLHTNSLDEALALPTDFSAAIARNTQLLLQTEAHMCDTIDPWGGSYFVERLTHDLATRALGHIEEVEALGGMAKAISDGLPMRRIEAAAAQTQALIDTGQRVLVGVNAYETDAAEEVPVLKVETADVRRTQIEKLERLRAERDPAAVEAALDALTSAAADEKGPNLLALAVDAVRAKATVGEVSYALERAWGRHQTRPEIARGTYAAAAGADDLVARAQAAAKAFEKAAGRKPRIAIVKMGQDGHDRGQKVVASAFADLGWDVEAGPLFQTPEEAARLAQEFKADIVAASSLAAGHMTLVPELKRALATLDLEDVMIIVGGVIPPDDVGVLKQMGAAAVFPPGAVISKAAIEMLELLGTRLRLDIKETP
jgi:methylmalonyl-CoA mutase